MRFPGSDPREPRTSVRPPGRRGVVGRLAVVAAIVVLFFGAGTLISWYVEALWFESLGYGDVFWKTLGLQTGTFSAFTAVTFVLLFGALRVLRPSGAAGRLLYLNGQEVTFSLQPVITVVSWVAALFVSLAAGSGMMGEWATFALYLHAPAPAGVNAAVDPVFGRSISFYLFTLPVWHLLANWLTTLAAVVVIASLVSVLVGGTGGERVVFGGRGGGRIGRGVSFSVACLLLVLAWRVYLSRFDRLFLDHTIFSGVGYTDDHVIIPGLLLVAIALAAGALIAFYNGLRPRRLIGIVAAFAPAVIVYVGLTLVSWYVTGFIVKPNQLVRERQYISHNIDFTRRAFDLARIGQRPFPADPGVEAVDLENNRATIDNIRLWDWRALQDTLRQIQEIRTYYDFPDIDIDRYRVHGRLRQMMVAARELNVDRLPESSRNWINLKLIYTHGYGVTMNPVNGFTAEGLPELVLGNMPVQSTAPEINVKRPEIYFGQLTNTDVYVRTRQREFNYPQGESNSYTAYDGRDGIVIGSGVRRLLVATNSGDLSKLPFSDDITPESRLLMRRNVRDRVRALAPFLTYDLDPYIVVGDDGHLYWLMDAFTSSDAYPYARHYLLGDTQVNYLRNSVKVSVDAYDGTVTFYVFDPSDPIIGAYRGLFPSLFADASAMPAGLRAHVRYPELLLKAQASAFALYHMRDPEVFYNREDLWSVASEVTLSENREQVTRPLEPNFVLMKLPGESNQEFVEILPFTPSNRNNLIGWIAGRSDGPAYGSAVVYDFPKTRLVDGPLQIEARIDQNSELSSQLTLWNQQGSHVRRGSLIVIPVGRALLFAKPIYLQAVHSPMPELRLVVLALQDRLGYGPTFQAAMNSLFGAGTAGPSPAPEPASPPGAETPTKAGTTVPPGVQALIEQAGKELAEYQRLTAEGKLGEAGQRLESLKRVLEQLKKGS
jgi:uncharacterized protein